MYFLAKNLCQQGLQVTLITTTAITLTITIIVGPPEVLLYLAEGCWGGRSGEQHIADGGWKVMIVFWFDFRHPHHGVLIKILQITDKLIELLDSQVPDSSHDFDPIKQVEARVWDLDRCCWRLIIVVNDYQHHQMLDQAGGVSCSISVWWSRSLWSWSNVGVDGLYNDYNQKLTKSTSTRRVASTEGKRRGLSILRRWSGEASDPRYIQIFHCDHDWSKANLISIFLAVTLSKS